MDLAPYNPDPLEVLTAMFDAPCLLPAQRVTMWTIPHMVRPALSGTRHGTGDLLLALAPIQHRPCYYLVWIDSAWWPRDGDLDLERLDEIEIALEDEFGRRDYDDTGRYEWPMGDFSDGVSWRRADENDILTAAARKRLIPAWEQRAPLIATPGVGVLDVGTFGRHPMLNSPLQKPEGGEGE